MDILYEDDGVVVVNKPAGVLVHSSHVSGSEKTVCDWFVDTYPASRTVGEQQQLADGSVIDRPGIVHRLDKDTSGVLVLAKTQSGYESLKDQFKNRAVKKVYTALVYGEVRKKEWCIDRPIAKHVKDFRRYTSREGRGVAREARTCALLVEQLGSYALLSLTPETGRTHQIRVHLSDDGHPIVCDPLYARGRVCPLMELSRQALHATEITFTNPHTGRTQEVQAPIPADMANTLASLRLAC